MYCSNCGKEIDDKAVVCVYCGVATHNLNDAQNIDMNRKSKIVAGLLAIFVGSLGIHNFYLGYKDKGVIQLLLTVVGWIVVVGPIIAWVWSLTEAIQIFTESINKDGDGRPLRE